MWIGQKVWHFYEFGRSEVYFKCSTFAMLSRADVANLNELPPLHTALFYSRFQAHPSRALIRFPLLDSHNMLLRLLISCCLCHRRFIRACKTLALSLLAVLHQRQSAKCMRSSMYKVSWHRTVHFANLKSISPRLSALNRRSSLKERRTTRAATAR